MYLVSFRSVGEIWAASLAQGGPPPCCLRIWCFKYLCDRELQIEHISKEDVCDAQYMLLISQVKGLKGFTAVKCLASHLGNTEFSALTEFLEITEFALTSFKTGMVMGLNFLSWNTVEVS